MAVTIKAKRRAALAAVACFVGATTVAAAEAPQSQTRGHMITTGGTLDFGDRPAIPRRVRPSRAAQNDNAEQDLLTFFERLFDPSPAPAPRPRRIAAPRPKLPAGGAVLAAPASPTPSAPAVAAPATPPVAPFTTVITASPQPTPNVVTGAIDRTLPPPSNQDDLDAAVIGDAEISQAREDMVKLELARRTYDETRLSGQFAFDQRIDWRVLERGRDAWTDGELAAANATGFEANTYINDTTRTIIVAIAGTQDLRRDFFAADIWDALIQAQSPQHFFLAKSYIRSVQARYQAAGYHTECVGHSLGGGACAYAGSELGIRATVVNPISAGRLGPLARNYVTNYVVDGDIAAAIYALRGNELSGDVQRVRHGREAVRKQLKDRYGILAGPIRVVRDIQNAVKVHQIERALDIIAAYAGTQRVK